MLIWVAAMHCEAKPVIDFYRLRKSHDDNAFDLYRGDGMVCVISGIGKVASAAACAWIASRYPDAGSLAWINLGTAGAAEHDIGELFYLNQVIDADTDQRYYPVITTGPGLPGTACLTLSRPSNDYDQRYLFDMEASGFMFSCLRFSTAELVQSLKVISDNREVQTGRDRQRVSHLIQQQMASIDAQAQALQTLNHEVAARRPDPEIWQRLLDSTHFTQSQKNQLRVLWRYLVNRGFDSERLLAEQTCASASDIIASLQALCYQDSERLS